MVNCISKQILLCFCVAFRPIKLFEKSSRSQLECHGRQRPEEICLYKKRTVVQNHILTSLESRNIQRCISCNRFYINQRPFFTFCTLVKRATKQTQIRSTIKRGKTVKTHFNREQGNNVASLVLIVACHSAACALCARGEWGEWW